MWTNITMRLTPDDSGSARLTLAFDPRGPGRYNNAEDAVMSFRDATGRERALAVVLTGNVLLLLDTRAMAPGVQHVATLLLWRV